MDSDIVCRAASAACQTRAFGQRVFGYRFDFGDEWFHQIQVERIEPAIPTVTYPRVIKRVGKSPPQYPEE